MSFLNNLINSWNGVNIIVGSKDDYIDQVASMIGGKSNSFQKTDSVSSVYTCVRILTDAVSRLPINIMNVDKQNNRIQDRFDPLFYLLHYSPNPYTNSQKFFATLEAWRNLHGNAYAKIHRERGKPSMLTLIPPSHVTYGVINDAVYYKILNQVDGKATEEIVNGDDMLHFTFGNDDSGIGGINPIAKLRMNLSTTVKGYKTIDSFYSNNATSSKAVSYPTYAPNQKSLKESVEKFQKEFAGPQNAGKLLTLPEGANIIDLQMNFKDAEFISTIKFNTGQIASLYGVPAHLVGIYESTKFNSVEQMQLDFKVNTMAAILRMYRMEMEQKLLTRDEQIMGKSIEFNTNALVETDLTSRIDAITKQINWGMISPNQANRIEGIQTYDGGDLHWMPLNNGFVEKEYEKPILNPNI